MPQNSPLKRPHPLTESMILRPLKHPHRHTPHPLKHPHHRPLKHPHIQVVRIRYIQVVGVPELWKTLRRRSRKLKPIEGFRFPRKGPPAPAPFLDLPRRPSLTSQSRTLRAAYAVAPTSP